MVVVSYDINTESKSGQRRLRHVAKICLDYGQRVQNSVFECKVNSMQLELMKERLGVEHSMQNDEVKDKADTVIGSNDEEGIADFIRGNLLDETL